jgi:redox-sensitive bicupin YhaK (pirin superfamily)
MPLKLGGGEPAVNVDELRAARPVRKASAGKARLADSLDMLEGSREIDVRMGHELRSPDALIGRGEGSGFFGYQWREKPGSGAVLLCDSYVMTAPTFPLHPHRHISAVAIVFEDSMGQMYSTDSVGTNHHFGPGDVHWTLAGSGVQHTQTPTTGSRIHAVQMFIDLPEALRDSPARTFHLPAKDAPVHQTANCRVRLLVGAAFGLRSPLEIPQDLLVMEGTSDSDLEIPVPEGWKLWMYDRVHDRAGYTSEPTVNGAFLALASPM